MGTRYFCDGCDQEVGFGRWFQAGLYGEKDCRSHDLPMPMMAWGNRVYFCQACEAQMRSYIDPQKWPRDRCDNQ